MKKSLFIISLLCVSMAMMAQEEKKDDAKGVHPYKTAENETFAPRFSHFAIVPHIGFNVFDGDFNSEMKHAVSYPSAGIGFEYAFTPAWAVGLEYMYDRYGVFGKPGANNADTLLFGQMHRAGVYVSLDLITLFFPRAERHIVGIEPLIGGGYAWYKNSIMFPDDTRYHTASVAPTVMDGFKGVAYLRAGLGIEFNLNRTLALGLRATYSYFINDYPDGRGYSGINAVASKNNDGLVDVTLNMKFKFRAVSRTHVRNIADEQVWLDKIEEKEAKCVHDTVIIVRHDSIIVREKVIEHKTSTIQQMQEQDRTFYVYFENNKSKLDDKGLITIQQVADIMNSDAEVYAVVTGFCDNTGSDKTNYALGDKRAENVLGELREEYGISDDHLYSMGMGKLVGRRSQAAYGPNRRAVIRLVDKATFDSMKSDLANKRANRVIEEEPAYEAPQKPIVKTVPLSESAKPQKKENTYKQRTGETITTEATTTLSKLARQYYNNTYCWVYIYIANKEKIKNPNALVPGIELTIPELTEKEMRITKDQSLVLYGNARQEK